MSSVPYPASPAVPDDVLIQAFLALTHGTSTYKAAAAATGVTQSDVSRWRRGKRGKLTDEKRAALEAFVRERLVDLVSTRGGAGPGAWERARITERLDAVDQIRRHGLDFDQLVADFDVMREAKQLEERRTVEVAAARREEEEAADLFADFDRLTRFIGGIAPPGQERDLKLDALEGYRRMITARMKLPGWFLLILHRVQEGEL